MSPEVHQNVRLAQESRDSIEFEAKVERAATARALSKPGQTRGLAGSSQCPNAGYLWLRTKSERAVVVRTNCKVWACLSCRDRLLAMVKMRMEIGCSILGHCFLITLTYQADAVITRDALSVSREWARFLRLWKKRHPVMTRSLAWFKVPELTRRSIPHLHVLAGPLRQQSWRSLQEEILRPIWKEVTGDSYIVDVRPVLSPERISNYLEKYFVKGMEVREALESLGFKRRYSRSNNWPSGPLRIAAVATGELRADGWESYRADPSGAMAARSDGDPLLERSGIDLAVALGDRAVKRRMMKVVEGVRNGDHGLPGDS